MIDDIEELINKYGYTEEEKKEFFSFIIPIISHEEFIKRYDAKNYPHHGNVSLGYHILNDAVLTYIMIKRKEKYKKVNIKLAVIIAMFHDLYELPWQNSPHKKHQFTNRHGFTHPIEAVINAITWFPEYFENKKDAEIIIDGIIHHMYPFPVRRIINEISDLELNNQEKYKKLLPRYKAMLINSTNRFKMFKVSIAKSKYKEGRIVSRADKKISMGKELKSINSLQSCITGKFWDK